MFQASGSRTYCKLGLKFQRETYNTAFIHNLLFQIICEMWLTDVISELPLISFFRSAIAPIGTGPLHYRGVTITLRRAPLYEQSALCRDQNTHKRETSMPRRIRIPQSQQVSCRRSTS